MSNYISWAMGLTYEPLPDYRNYMVNPIFLEDIGNTTVNAAYAQLDVDCQPFAVAEYQPAQDSFAYFNVDMPGHDIDGRQWNSSDHVKIKLTKGLAVWADDFDFINRNASSLRTVSAAINGSIEGGTTTVISAPRNSSSTFSISAVAFEVRIELMDRILQIGKGGPPSAKDQPMTTISSLDTIHIEFANNTEDQSSPENTLNENTPWFAAAPIIVCPSVEGAQPMYTLEGGLERTRLPSHTQEGHT